MSKQRRIKSNDTIRATRKRPNTMATLRDKSTILTVARAPKYDKQTTKSPINRIQRTSPCHTASTVDNKSHVMSSAEVDIQINEDKWRSPHLLK